VPSVPGGSLVVKVERHRADGLGLRAIATKLGISVNTLQKAREGLIGRGTRSSTLLVRVEDVFLRLHGHMARVSAV
jgi:hypothetical protein